MGVSAIPIPGWASPHSGTSEALRAGGGRLCPGRRRPGRSRGVGRSRSQATVAGGPAPWRGRRTPRRAPARPEASSGPRGRASHGGRLRRAGRP